MTTPPESVDAIPDEELLPCPFCSGEASADGVVRYSESHAKEQGWDQREFYYCNCIRCGSSNKGIIGHESRGKAITAWNRRARNAPDTGGTAELVGWKLVPVEPTEEMIGEGDRVMYGRYGCSFEVAPIYSAMLDAAPPAPAASPACGGEVDTTLLSVIADLRMKTGVGAKPMLSELADAVAAKIAFASPGQGEVVREQLAKALEALDVPQHKQGDEKFLRASVVIAKTFLLNALTSPEQGEVVQEIAAERQRQIDAEGWTPEHDDKHCRGEMLLAAISYVMNSAVYAQMRAAGAAPDTIAAASATAPMPSTWPWATEWWKPKNPRRNLVRAAALIIAEIERLDRAALAKIGGDHVK